MGIYNLGYMSNCNLVSGMNRFISCIYGFIILWNLIVILLSYLISDLHRSSTYCYRYTAILSFRGLILIALQCLYVAPKGNQGNGYKEGVENDKTMQFTV